MSETAEDVPFRVQNQDQSVCVAVESAVKILCFKTITAVLPQKRKPLLLELCEDLLKI
jgi:hypothetical protein